MEKQAIEEAEKEGETLPPGEIKLPMFKELQAKKRADAQKKFLEERVALENNLTDIEKQIQQIPHCPIARIMTGTRKPTKFMCVLLEK